MDKDQTILKLLIVAEVPSSEWLPFCSNVIQRMMVVVATFGVLHIGIDEHKYIILIKLEKRSRSDG